MALAFKRAVADAEKAVESVNNSIKGWYFTTVNPAVVVDFESIKTIEGVSKQNPNSVEGPKNITLVNWVKDNAQYLHSFWGDVQYKDKKYALAHMLPHIEKLVLHVDDKGVAGKYNSYDLKFEGKTADLTVHIDFTNYPQQFSMSDEKQGPSLIQRLWAHLDKVANITYEIRKETMIKYESSPLHTHQKYLKEKLKKDIPIEIDWASLFALEGESIEYSNKPPVPNRARAVHLLGDEGKGLYYTYYSIETLCKDAMGLEAFLETFDKVTLHVLPGIKESFTKDAQPTIVKDGKTLKFSFEFATANFQNARWDYGKMAKQIEALL
jgi:hypothetical protein